VETGKFVGEFPFTVNVSALYKGKVYLKTLTIDASSVALTDSTLPQRWTGLVQIYPNPFNSSTKINIRLQKGVRADQARIAIVRTFDSGVLSSSTVHTYTWDGTNDFGRAVSSGVYFFTLTTPRGTFTTRLLLSK